MRKSTSATRGSAGASDAAPGPACAPAPGADAGAGDGKPGQRTLASYADAMAYLDARMSVERTRLATLDHHAFKLERMHAIARALGDPQLSFKTVHVAGSKGKGSVCEMLAAALQGCGYTTGLYTSPHLVDLRERVRTNGVMISPDEFRRALERAARAADEVTPEHGEATFFEVVTAAAFVHYAEQAVDVAVVEVGLGGRLDATNIITPEVSAVTAIQLEHTQILGDTLEQIAREKAGIFKRGVPAITIPQQSPSIIDTFRQVAQEVGTTLAIVGKDVDFSHRVEANAELGPHVRVSLTSPRSSFEHIVVPLKGEHQAANCGLVLAVLDALRARGFDTPERKVAEGLARTPSHGRLEMVSRSPRVVVDGAHNPESVQALVRALGAHVRYDSMVMIFGCAADKNVAGMLQKIALGADKVIFTRASSNARAADPRELARKFAEATGKSAQVAPTFAAAYDIARAAVGRDDIICVTGSFYLAGEAKRHFAEVASGGGARGGGAGAARAGNAATPPPSRAPVVETTPRRPRAKRER